MKKGRESNSTKPPGGNIFAKLPDRSPSAPMLVNGGDVAAMLARAKLPPIDAVAAHNLAAILAALGDRWADYSGHPDAKVARDNERNRRNRRIAAALAVLQDDLAAFMADTAPRPPIMFAPGFIEPLRYHVDRVAPGFASALEHGAKERWHIIADHIETILIATYPNVKIKTGAKLCFIGDALAAIGVNVTADAIRKRK